MSHPLYNFIVSGKQSSSQRPCELSIGQAERDSLQASPQLGSSLGSSETTPVSPVKSRVMGPSRLAPPLRYRAGMKEAMLDEDIESVLDLNISDARKDKRHQLVNQSIHFTSALRDEFPSLKTRVMTYQSSSASRGPSNNDHSLDWLQICKKAPIRDSSLDWLQICKKATFKLYSSSTHLSGDRRLETSSGVENKIQSTTESSCSKYTPELARTFERFGLDKHDLDHLLSYCDDQITTESLPLILQQIYLQKGKVHSEPLAKPPPTTKVRVMDRRSSSGVEMFQDGILSAGLKSSPVYGGTSEDASEPDGAVGGKDDGVGSRSVSMIDASSHRESPQKTLQVKIGVLGSAASLSSVVPPTCDPTKPLQTQTNQDSLPGLTLSSLPKQDQNTTLLKSEVSKNVTLKEPETPKTQPFRALLHGSGPSRPEHAGNNSSNNNSCTEVQNQGSEITQLMKTQTLQHRKQPASQIVFLPQVKPAEPPKKPSVPGTITGPPAAPQLVPTLVNSIDTLQPSSSRQSPDQEHVSKGAPPPSMVEDYFGVTPRRFPHTCSLCNDISLHMKGWLSHQNDIHHLDNRKLLLKRYPEWDSTAHAVRSAGCQNRYRNSRSRSPSPRRNHSLRGRRSRSRSPRYDRRPSARNRSRSRSHERRSTYRRTDEKPSSLRKSCENPSGRPQQRGSSSTEKPPEKTAVKSQSDQETVGNIRSTSSSAARRGCSSEVRQKSDAGSSGTLQNAASSNDRMEPRLQKVSESTTSRSIQESSSGGDESKQTVEISDKLKAETQKIPASKPKSDSVASTDRLVSAGRNQTCEESRKTTNQRTYSSDPVTSLTVGEMIEIHLQRENLMCSFLNTLYSTKRKRKLILMDNLPVYDDGCYTEADVANLLRPFGFQYVDSNIYVIPKLRMAFVVLPSVRELQMFIRKNLNLTFKGSELVLEVVHNKVITTPFQFYKYLMELMNFKVTDDGSSVIYIQNISPNETRDLRATLRKIGSVRNYLPLLNKVFIEFDSFYDADRLGVWYSLLNQGLNHKVYRMKLPRSSASSPRKYLSPRRGSDISPGIKEDVARTTTLTNIQRIPQGSLPPFWVTMTTAPYTFPTASPWFIIPDFMTINQISDITEAQPRASVFSTVMLTGLPGRFDSHEDVAELVSCCFPKKNRQSLNFDLIVLTMQKRAFVYFSSWESCHHFVLNYITNPVSVRGFTPCPSIHFVLQDLHPGFSEETVYSNLMKWSNAHFPVLETLESRLLRVELSKIDVFLIMRVMEAVASIAPFTNYLALANKIYIEMAETSDAEKVEEVFLTGRGHETWRNVLRVECLSTRKHLKDLSHFPASSKLDVVLDKEHPSASSGSNDYVTEQSLVTLKEMSNTINTPLASNMTPSSDQVLNTERQQLEREDDKTTKINTANMETSKTDPPTQEQEIQSNQTWSEEGEVMKPKGQEHTEDGGINQILGRRMDEDEKQDGRTETQKHGPEGDEGRPEEPSEMEKDASINVKDGITENYSATALKIEDSPKGSTEQETFEILDPIYNKNVTKGGHILKTVKGPTEDDDDVDQLTKNGKKMSSRDDGPTRRGQLKISMSKREDKSTGRKYETRAKNSKTGKETVFDVVDTDEEALTKEGSGRRQSSKRLKNDDETLSSNVEERITARSTRGGKTKTDENLTRSRAKPAREVQQQNKENTPTKKRESTCEVQSTQKPRRGASNEQTTALKEGDSSSEEAAATNQVLVSKDQVFNPLEKNKVQEKVSERSHTEDTTAAVKRSEKDDVEEEEMKDGHVAATKNQTSDSLQAEAVNETDKQTKDKEKKTLRSAKRRHEDETGEDFVERKLGFFCSLCSIFYLNESKMEDQHCCSRGHYDNLKKYYQKLQQSSSRKSKRNPVRR